MRNRLEIRLIEFALLPVKFLLWVTYLIIAPAPRVTVHQHKDTLGYYVDDCPICEGENPSV